MCSRGCDGRQAGRQRSAGHWRKKNSGGGKRRLSGTGRILDPLPPCARPGACVRVRAWPVCMHAAEPAERAPAGAAGAAAKHAAGGCVRLSPMPTQPARLISARKKSGPNYGTALRSALLCSALPIPCRRTSATPQTPLALAKGHSLSCLKLAFHRRNGQGKREACKQPCDNGRASAWKGAQQGAIQGKQCQAC